MKPIRVMLSLGMLCIGMVLLCSALGQAQQSVAAAANATVPPLIQFSSVATDEGGNTLSGVVSVTFSLYTAQRGGEPLWTETQNNVQLDPTGHYSVQLGITKPTGVPATLFTTGEARWLGVRIAEQGEQSRVLLLSVPYALKAGDAATIGGLPPSAFVLAAPQSATAAAYIPQPAGESSVSPATAVDVTTSGGTVSYLPLWDSTSDIISSVLLQSGSGSTARIGINTATPATTLDVKGTATIRGILNLPATGAATATAGKNSQPLNLAAAAFSSTTSTAVNQTFQWQAEPAGNDTSAPSGTLNLLFGEGATKPSETGLNIASNGLITFATGQTFPGTGEGTITGVTAGTDLTGGGTTGSVTLNVDTTKIPQLSAANIFTANQTVNGTVTATSFSGNGAGLTSVTAANSNELGGLTASAFAQLAASNTFTTNQTVKGTVTATSFTGNGAGLTNVTAANSNELGGLASSAFAKLTASNSFTGTQTMSGTSSAGVLQVTNTTTAGSAPGIVGTTNSTNASGVKGVASATSGTTNGVFGTTASPTGYGVQGASQNVGVYGTSSGADGAGVSGSGQYIGVYATSSASDGYGVSANSSYIGVYGQAAGVAGVTAMGNAGVWGNTGGAAGDGYYGVLGTASDNSAGGFFSLGSYPTLYAENDGAFSLLDPQVVFEAVGQQYDEECVIYATGDMGCGGTTGSVAKIGGARKVSLYAVQSPENWFEDFGSGTLVNGAATVGLDPTFAQTVNATTDYHVFLTPNGDCKGLYVSQKSASSFEIRELGGGRSSVAFDYRIVAKRIGYENVRLRDVTERYRRLEQQQQQRREQSARRAAQSAARPIATPSLASRK
jgi:hypothetical protein